MQTPNLRPLLWLLLAAVLALKTSYLLHYVGLPFLYGPIFDSSVYLAQAGAVRAGQFGDPTLLAFSPLYGYFLALLGSSPGLTVLVQLALGCINLVLIARMTQRGFGALAGLLCAVLYLGYGVLVFYETKIMSETLGLSLLLLAMQGLTSPHFVTARAPTCIAAGLGLGLATLARASLLPSLPFFVLWSLLAKDHEGRSRGLLARAPRTALLTLGLVLVFGANGLWTLRHSGIFVPVILVSDTAAQASRAGEWRGDLTMFAKPGAEVSAWNVVEQARARLARVAGGEPRQEREGGFDGVDLAGYLRSAPKKAWLTLADTETSFDYGYYGERTEIPALRFASVSFGMLTSLALLGLGFAFHARLLAPLGSLVPIVVGVFITTTVFHPSTRYRLPLVLALLPLAGYALSRLPAIAPPAWRRFAVGAVALVCVAFVVRTLRYQLASPAMWHLRVAEAASVAGDRPEAEQRLARALALAPDDPAVRRRVAYVERLIGPGPRPRSH